MSHPWATVLVTGGAGYIGSHAVLALQRAGYQPLVLDNFSTGHRDLVEQVLKVPLIEGDIRQRELLDQVFRDYPIAAVLHFAAYTDVGESVRDPGKYHHNNFYGSLVLLEAMAAAKIKTLVFSSSAAVYGIPTQVPIPEDQSQDPINPYGHSKQMVELLLQDFEQAYGIRWISFRYFNAAGADPQARLGEDHRPETHLIPLVLLTALGHRTHLSIYGQNHSTSDGTCVRDFVHVVDLATAHVQGLEYLLNGGSSVVCNLSLGQGFSVRQVIDLAADITGQRIPVQVAAPRTGDPALLVGHPGKARRLLGWDPMFPELEAMLRHAWAWHQKRHGQ